MDPIVLLKQTQNSLSINVMFPNEVFQFTLDKLDLSPEMKVHLKCSLCLFHQLSWFCLWQKSPHI